VCNVVPCFANFLDSSCLAGVFRGRHDDYYAVEFPGEGSYRVKGDRVNPVSAL
jgi:hypothetical protein